MEKSCWIAFSACLLVALAGCMSVSVFEEPEIPPREVQDYQVAAFSDQNPRRKYAFDLAGCLENAVISAGGLSGVSHMAGTFALLPIIEREVGMASDANFRPVAPGEKPDAIVHVETKTVIVERSWAKYTAEMVFVVKVDGLGKAQGRRVFRKEYSFKEMSEQNEKVTTVPVCVYSCVQKFVKQFIDDAAVADYGKNY